MSIPIMIGGKRIGKFKASFLLFKESWRFLTADKELLLIPLITALLNLFLLGIVIAGVALVAQSANSPIFTGESLKTTDYTIIFLVYVIGAFTLAVSQSAITHTVYTRIHGGNATLMQSLRTAFSLGGSLLVWAVITSTVGIVLKITSDRSALLGKIVAALMGAAWAIATFFVIPAMVIIKKSATEAIPFSVATFRKTWGETLVTNISLGLFFVVLHIVVFMSFFGLIWLGVASQNLVLIFLVIIALFLWFVIASLVFSALQGILKTLLYVYATEGVIPTNFNPELLESMLAGRVSAVPPQVANPDSATQTTGQ